MNEPLIVSARDGIEAQRGLNDIFPGDPYPVRDQLKRGLDSLRAHVSGRGRITSLEVFSLTDPLMDILARCEAKPDAAASTIAALREELEAVKRDGTPPAVEALREALPQLTGLGRQVRTFSNGPVALDYGDREFLGWLHNRLIYLHGEKPNVDYMQKLAALAALHPATTGGVES